MNRRQRQRSANLRPILRRLRNGTDHTAVKIIAQPNPSQGKPPSFAMLNQIPDDLGIPKRVTIRALWYNAYRSTKAVEDALIRALARQHDPLGVRGKYAMVQGQFEAQFWDELDRAIKELKKRS